MNEDKLSRFNTLNSNKMKQRRKRELHMLIESPTLSSPIETSKRLKLSFSQDSVFSEMTEYDNLPVLHYTSTKNYTKIVAKPQSLPPTPKIFHTNVHSSQVYRNGTLNFSDVFLSKLLSSKSFNMGVNKRFSPIVIDKGKKKAKQKVNKERNPQEKLERAIKNKEEKLKKKIREQENVSETKNWQNKESENLMNPTDVYTSTQNVGLIFHMKHPAKFSFHGEIKITIIAGEVEVLGYTLSSSQKTLADVYSPKFYMPLIIETKLPKESQSASEKLHEKLKYLLTEENFKTIVNNFKPQDSILFVQQIQSNVGIVVNKYFDTPLFPKDLEDISSTTETLKSLQSIFNFKISRKEKHFRKSPHWDKIPLGHCTVLCGGKGVGKSTLLKYYINKFVTLGEKVLCLDFDPAQSEFTFPGCISAVVVGEPLLGPNFTHVMEPVLMTYVGDVDVSSNPGRYLNCVKYIVDACIKNEELLKMKWFVNTMGFCKGVGVNLTITILKLLQPNTVIQIKASDRKNNFPFYLTPVALNSRKGFNAMPLDNVIVSYDLRMIYSCAELGKKQLQGGLKPRQLRDIMAISYFSKMVFSPFYNFNAVQPYLISFSKLYLGLDFLINPNNVLKAFNGNVVSLSHLTLLEADSEDVFSIQPEDDIYLKVIVKPSVAPSLGIGVVRGIDCKEKKFYLMTHLPIEILNKVNCLTLGRVGLPHPMFLKQETVERNTVYTTLGSFNAIHRVKRMFRVPGTAQTKEKVKN